MNSVITNFLKNYRVDGRLYTHVSMIQPKGKYQLSQQNLEKFWNVYSEELYNNSITCGIAEKSQHYLPVLVDIDLKQKEDELDTEKIYGDEQVISTVEVYQSILRNILEDCTDDNLICLVLEKPPYRITKNNITYIKNGFHLHFPFTFLSKVDQEVHLVPRVRKKLKELNTFEKIGFDKIDEIVDKGYIKAPWLLYGSKKQENMDSYKVTSCFNADGEEIELKKALSNYNIYNDKEENIEFEKDIEYYLPRILSIIPYGREVCELKNDVSFPVEIQNINNIKKMKEFKHVPIEENLRIAQKLLNIISDERSNNYNDWMTIGWALYNISNGCKEGLELWIEFSRKCGDKFNESVCHYEWSKMIKKDMTIGTLKHYAKLDNEKEYYKIIGELVKPHINNSLNGSHNDIAKALYEIYGSEFKCGSTIHKTWYRYRNHVWQSMEDGVYLREKISDEIVYEYEKIGKDLVTKLGNANDEGEKAMYSVRLKQVMKLMNNLKSAPYKSNVMKEAREVFYDEDFNRKLDANPWLIAFKNGVYDLKQNVFRDGRPDDYISISMGVDYNKDLTEDHQSVLDVHEFLEKIFPDRSVREYFLDTSSDVFVGGNASKHVIFWSGEGDNGKSITQTIFEKMLGKYAIKLPTTLITGKRAASSAACPELVRAGNGVRWAVLQEPDKKDVINIGTLKELSGNDTFYARGLFKEGGEITPMFKLVLICNDPPGLPYSDKATWNRIRVIPFESTFCDNAPESYEEQLLQKRFPKDRHFASKIPGMLQAFAWVLLEHRKNIKRRVEPDKVQLATASYRKQNDIYRQFIEESIIECNKSTISLVELYAQFKEWFKDSLPNHQLPIKNEIKEYFIKLWGDPAKGYKWNGYRIRTIQDDILDEEAVVLNDDDLVDYSNNNAIPNL